MRREAGMVAYRRYVEALEIDICKMTVALADAWKSTAHQNR